jgi:hypothetical protein
VRIRRLFDGVTDWDVAPTEPALSSGEPRVVSDGGIGVWVAWKGPVVGDGAIWVQHLLEDGTRALGDAGRKLAGALPQYDLRAASDGAGGMFLSWSSFTPAVFSLYIQHVTAAGAVAPGWPHQGRFVVTPDTAEYSERPAPTLLADGLGGTYLLWAEYQHGRAYALHLLADGSRAPGWPTDGLLVVDRVSSSVELDDATNDGVGGLFASVTSDEEGGRTFVVRIGPDGERPAGWPEQGLAVCSGGSSQGSSRLIGQSGGALVVWQDAQPGSPETDIHGARFLADGSHAPGWPESGLVLCDAPGSQVGPVLGPSGADGAIVAWTDMRNEATPGGGDIYTQTVDARGNVGVLAGAVPERMQFALAALNPVRGVARFTLELPAASRVVADVLDVSGRTLARIEDATLDAGRHELAWDAGRASPGVRFLRIQTAAGERSVRFVTLR